MWRALPESECPGGPNPPDFFDIERWRQGNAGDVSAKRCSHFSVSVGTLDVPGIHPPLRVPIYRCSLTELMVARLQTSDEGGRLASMLEAPPLNDIPRLVCGPDLEAITTTACTPERCRQSCRSGFAQILSEFGLDASEPEDQ
jgi:hypothetical protein